MPIGPMLLQGATGAPDRGQPTPTALPAANPTRPSTSISTSWSDWMSKPENRAGMIQAGLALLQPVSVGQTQVGHIANAIGQGFAAQGRNVKSRQDQELELRRIAADESRARAAETSAQNEASGLTPNQRFARWIEFLNSRAQAMADQNLFSGEGGDIMSADQVRQQIMQNPQLQAQLWQEFLQTEAQVVPGAGGSAGGTTSLGAAVGGGGASTSPQLPKVGDVYKGYRFLGGDPALPESWERVQ